MTQKDMGKLFRKTALEQLSSPERLDALVQVTTPKGWIALATLGGLVVTMVAWGFLGSIPTQVQGACVLTRTGGVYEVSTNAAGRISDIAVSVGDTVRQGECIARMDNPALMTRFRDLEFQRSNLAAKNRQRDQLLDQQHQDLERQIATLEGRIRAQRQLVRDGLITKQNLMTTRDSLAEKRSRLKQIRIKRIEYTDSYDDLTREIDALRSTIALKTKVDSPYSGRVLSIKASDGQIVKLGAPVITMELRGDSILNLVPLIYVNAGDGKRVKPGMRVLVSPSTVQADKYGYMVGSITQVAAYPATVQGMMRTLQNHQLVNELTGGAVALEIHAILTPSQTTISGYRWTSAGGPPRKIQTGTLCRAKITVRQQRPISLVIPALKKLLGT